MTLRQLAARRDRLKVAATQAAVAVHIRIVEDVKAGRSQAEVAEELGVTRQHIHNIVKKAK